MSYAQRLHLRLFLEGIEIPVISANIQSQPNQSAVASIQIPANDYALEFKARTLVHLFFYDFYRGAPPEGRAFVGGEGVTVQQGQDVDPELQGVLSELRIDETTKEQIVIDLENDNYKLLYGGEVVGFSAAKTPTTRSIVLQCIDWSSYWDFAFQYQVSGFNWGGGGIKAAFTGASTTVFNSFLDGTGDIISEKMAEPPRSWPSLKDTLLGSLVHIIEAVGGCYFGRRAIRGVNDFYSIAEMRLHLTQMVGTNPYSNEDEKRLMRANGFGSLFRRALSGLGKQVSIRAILNSLLKYIFYDIVPNTTPLYIPPTVDVRLPQFEEVGIEEDRDSAPLARAARQLKTKALNLKERQLACTSTQIAQRQSGAKGGLARELESSRQVAIRAERKSRVVGLSPKENRYDRLFRLPGVGEEFAATAEGFQGLIFETRRAQRENTRTNMFQLAGSRPSQQVVRICDRIVEYMEFVLASRHRRRIARTTLQADPPPRLVTQIWRPDVWMVAPPRSNVLFPELYSRFDYGRNYMAETTRLMLRCHSVFFGSDILFDGFYMAPSRALGQRKGVVIAQGRGGVEPPDLADAPAWFIRDLMEHELFTGILPKFERMSNLNLHALKGGSTEINSVKVGYAQLACNHIFFKQRFMSRQLTVSGKFNPFIILGFPSVIVDKYQSRDDIDNSEYDSAVAARLVAAQLEGEGAQIEGLPPAQGAEVREIAFERAAELKRELTVKAVNTHYLGTPMSLSHSVSADGGGTTSMQMGYARTTNETTEFLGDERATTGRAPRFKRVRDREVSSVVAWTSEPRVGDRGPRGGDITKVDDVTSEYQRRQRARHIAGPRGTSATGQERLRYASNTTLPLWVPGGTISGRRYRGTRVLVGVDQAASSYGPEVVALVGSVGEQQAGFINRADGTRTEVFVTFKAFRIKEKIGIYGRVTKTLPPEDLVFPPWYGEHWRSHRVGGIYSYLFGVGSIVDRTTLLGPPGGGSSSIRVGDGGDVTGVSKPTPTPPDIPRLTDPDDIPAAGQSNQPETSGLSYGAPGKDTDQESLGIIEGRGDINQAIEELVKVYSRVRQERWDTNEFIRSYTWRPIASIVDIFGTANLEISDSGEVLRGIEGFHSRAFGDFDDLRQLVQNVDGQPPRILGLTLEDPEDARSSSDRSRAERDQGVAKRLDTRKEKRLQVFKYLGALLASRGILG